MKDEKRTRLRHVPDLLAVSSRTIRQEFRLRALIGASQFADQVPSSSGHDVPLTWGRPVVRVHPGPSAVVED